jgi:7,8-dihydropterin-6-yl-methyl-4-(beta-D-ribofuranosyl)aminobenzene 5'-phosphate synthase
VSAVALEPVDRVRVTVLVDNLTDPLLVDSEAVWRMNWPRRSPVRSRTRPGDGTRLWRPDSLIAEPGFSALVRIDRGEHERTLLVDTGSRRTG